MLWLHGMAGAGKTVLCSTVIEDLKSQVSQCQDDNVRLAYFYFDFRDSRKQSVEDLFCSLLRQLVSDSASLPSSVTQLYEEYADKNHRPKLSELYSTLQHTVALCDRVYLVLDALDEAADRESLLDTLLEFMEATNRRVNILFSSRQEKDIEKSFYSAQRDTLHTLALGDYAFRVKKDIEEFIEKQLDVDRRFAKFKRERDLIRRALLNGAEGMYVIRCPQEHAEYVDIKQVSMGCVPNRFPPTMQKQTGTAICT